LRGSIAEDVQLTGYVEDEIRSADIVVPIRFGSGTRLKVLEAFTLETPVISTSVGCEGLDVEDSVHLWIADDADAFASKCTALIADPVPQRR
jgi:hypothetical protein